MRKKTVHPGSTRRIRVMCGYSFGRSNDYTSIDGVTDLPGAGLPGFREPLAARSYVAMFHVEHAGTRTHCRDMCRIQEGDEALEALAFDQSD